VDGAQAPSGERAGEKQSPPGAGRALKALGEAEVSEPSICPPPDRLVVGEVRGAEVVDLLAALNTGHEGGCGTLHANSAEDVPARLEALAAVAGLTRQALHSQLASGLRVVVHLVRPRGGGVRRVAELCVLTRGPDALVSAESAWTWDGAAACGVAGPGAGLLAQLL